MKLFRSKTGQIVWLLMIAGFVEFHAIAHAGCIGNPPYWDTSGCINYLPVPWPSENAWIAYTNKQETINDPRVLDPSNGGTRPQNYVNVSSGCPDQLLPSIYWAYDSFSQVLFFRWRVEQIGNKYATGPGPGAYSDSDPWFAALWTVFIDIDGDGYREFAFHIDGSSGVPSAPVDILRSIYSNTRSQRIDYNSDPLNIHALSYNPSGFIDRLTNILLNFQNRVTPTILWPNGASETVWDYGTTRSINISTSGCNEFFVDYQIPLGMMSAASAGGPTLTADTPIAMYFATANSLNDPLQKDWVQSAANSCTGPDCCLPYGDLLTLNGGYIPQPVIDWVKAEGCKPTKLTAQVRDALVDPCGTTLLSVEFHYYFDKNGNGDADDTGSNWTKAVDGANSPDAVSTWTATWDTSGLPEGEYLIGVRAEDQQGHVTWTYLTQAEVNNLPSPTPPMTYYANPSPIPGVVYDSFINTCGKGADVTKSVDKNSVLIGQPVRFMITVNNYDTVALHLNRISDVLPPGFSYKSSPVEGGGLDGFITGRPANNDQGTVQWTFSGAVIPANGGSGTLTFTANASDITGTYTNVAHAITVEQGILTSNPVDVGVGAPRLTIQKSASKLTANPGDAITYTISYGNDSPVNVTGVRITDPVPEGFTFVSVTGGGVYNPLTRIITWTIGNLSALDGPYTVSFTGTVDTENTPAVLLNIATIHSNETPDTDSGINIAIAINTPLAIQKTANPIMVNPGQQVVFTMNYKNNSITDQKNVVIIDPIPVGFSYVSASPLPYQAPPVGSNGTVKWNPGTPPGTLIPGASGSVTLTVQANNPYTGNNPAVNTATIDSDQTSPVSDSAEVAVTISTCSNPTNYYFRNQTANVGFDGTRRIANTTMGNATQVVSSSVNAEFIRFYMDPPASSAYSFMATVSFWGDKIAGSNPRATVELYDYDPSTGAKVLLATGTSDPITGGVKLYTIPVTGSFSGSLSANHRLLWIFYGNNDTFYFRYDGTTGGSGDSRSAVCFTPLTLSLDKWVDKISAAPGNSLVYTIQFANPSLTSATGAKIIDTLPDGVTLDGLNRPSLNGTLLTLGTDYTCSGQVCTFNVNSTGAASGVVANGGTGTLVINATINDPLAPEILSLLNTAELRTDQTLPLTDSATTRVISPNPELSIVKVADKTRLIPGDTVTFTLNVLNSGLGTATDVTVTDNLTTATQDTYFAYLTGSASNGGTYDSGTKTITWSLGNMDGGQSYSLTFQMVVAPTNPATPPVPPGVTTKDNSATATDQVGNHASNIVTVAISPNANLQITKTVSLIVDNNNNGKVNPGDTLEYTITTINIGGSNAENVLVRDPIPSNTSYKNGSLIYQTTSQSDANDADNAYFDAAGNRVMFNIGTLGIGITQTMKFRVTVDSLSNGTSPINNTATVSASNTASKQATATINAEAASVLNLRKNAPAFMPYPLATVSHNYAQPSNTIDVNSTQFINVGDVLFIGGAMVTVTAVNSATQITVTPAITPGNNAPVEPTFNFVYNYSNTGSTNATNVQVTDVLAFGLNYVSASPAPTSAPAFNTNGTVTWNLGTLSLGATGSLTIRVRPTARGTYLNTGSMSSTEVPSFNSNTTTTVLGTVLLRKSTSTPSVTNTITGTTATYTITLMNQTTTTSNNNVTVTDSLPVGFTYASTTGTPCTTLPTQPSIVTSGGLTYTCVLGHLSDTLANRPGTGANWRTYWVQKGTGGAAWTNSTSYTAENRPAWSGCTLGSGGTLTITFNVNIAPTVGSGTYQNPVSATSPVLSIMPFYELDTPAEDVTVAVQNDLAVTKVVQSLTSPCFAGSCEATFLITVRNVGTASENGVQVTDSLPAELIFLSSVPSGTTSYSNLTGIWDVGTLGASASATLQITARLDSSMTLQNCAELTSSNPADTNPANNKGCANVTPTRVFLSVFNSYEDKGRVVVLWETSAEYNTAGFYLLRLNEATGRFETMNDQIVPALIGSNRGGVYRFIDVGASPGQTYAYKLQEVEMTGMVNEYGPFSVPAAGPSAGSSLGPMVSSMSRTPHEVSSARKARSLAARKTIEDTKTINAIKKGNRIKISITEDGLYFLGAHEISTLLEKNLPQVNNLIRLHLLSLTHGGQGVAYLPAKDGSGLFFYGQGIESIYTKKNVYWLAQGKGLPMKFINGDGPKNPGTGDETFPHIVHIEENRVAAPSLFADPEADIWFWDFIFGGAPKMDTKTFTLRAKGVAGTNSTATLTVYLQGASISGADLDHHVVVSLNDNVIGEGRWKGINSHTLTLPFSQNLLQEGDNTIKVQGMLDDGVTFSLFLIDSFDLDYDRLYETENNALLCMGNGHPVVSIKEFTNQDIFVFDMTDPAKPKHVLAVTIDGTAGNYRVSFVPTSPETLYLAVSSGTALSAADLSADTPSKLSNKGNRADYIVLTASELKDAAQSLATYRKGQGLETMVVTLEDVMDEFNDGILDPKAIKSFLSYAYTHWKKAPKYVVLAGKGTYDYKDNLGQGGNLVPPMMRSTPFGLFASDSYFADVNGDSVPEMAIGRLPAVTVDELETLIHKIIAYESAGTGLWEKNVLMVADNPDDGGDFSADSDSLVPFLPSGYSVEKIYWPLAEAQDKLLDAINTGVLFMNYIGHSATDGLAHDLLVCNSDACNLDSLTNGERLPVVTAMTCFVNNFADPFNDVLGEMLVMKSSGGAIAVWGPTGLSLNSEAVALDKKLFQAVFGAGKKVLGDAVLKALGEFKQGGGQTFILDIYNIVGDPALRIR